MSEAKFTPGPWGWFGTAGGCPEIYLATNHSGRRYVMGFQRWGLNGAQPSFQPEGRGMVKAKDLLQFEVGDQSIVGLDAAQKDTSVYRFQIRGIAAPDAHLIAAAPELYEALNDLVRAISYREQFHDRNGPHLTCSDGEFIRSDVFDSWQTEISRACTALAKARGEA